LICNNRVSSKPANPRRRAKGQSRSPPKKHEDRLLELVRQEPDLTLEEIQRRLLDERQQKAGLGSAWWFFDRHGISFKKERSSGRAGSA
jgi:transposase